MGTLTTHRTQRIAASFSSYTNGLRPLLALGQKQLVNDLCIITARRKQLVLHYHPESMG
jgi:hypothetical protein